MIKLFRRARTEKQVPLILISAPSKTLDFDSLRGRPPTGSDFTPHFCLSSKTLKRGLIAHSRKERDNMVNTHSVGLGNQVEGKVDFSLF